MGDVTVDAGACRERVDVATFRVERELRALPEVRRPVEGRLDDLDELLVRDPRLAVLFFPLLRLAVLFLLVPRFAVLFLPVLRLVVLFFPVLRFAVVLLLAPRFAELRLLVPRFAVLFLPVLRFAVLFLPVLRFAVLFFPVLRFAVLFFPVRRFAVLFLLVLRLAVRRFAVRLVPVPRRVPPERLFAPVRFRDEPPPPADSASMSSSFRIREAPVMPARVARLRSSATVMSSMLRATSAPSPRFPLTCAVATPVRPPLIAPTMPSPVRHREGGVALSIVARLHREASSRRAAQRFGDVGRSGDPAAAFGRPSLEETKDS